MIIPWWDWNGSAWVASSLTDYPPVGDWYTYQWHEDTQKWTAQNSDDNTLNYEWNNSTQTWEEI